jgi:hypothetical protein
MHYLTQDEKKHHIGCFDSNKFKKTVEQKADRTIFNFSEQPSLNTGSVLEGIKNYQV